MPAPRREKTVRFCLEMSYNCGGKINVALQVADPFTSSLRTTSTTDDTLGSTATALVVQRNVLPFRCGASVNGPRAVAVATSLPSMLTVKVHVTLSAFEKSPPSAER